MFAFKTLSKQYICDYSIFKKLFIIILQIQYLSIFNK